MIKVSAPAKINLTLEVLGKRADGYHEVRSVIQTISLADSLSFEASDSFAFTSDSAGWDGAMSLVSRAAVLLADVTGTKKRAAVAVTKRIPLLSGLGGDSSDAAATLLGLNDLWGLNLTRQDLEPLASRLGSDVPFFLYRGTALLSGRGRSSRRCHPCPNAGLCSPCPRWPACPARQGCFTRVSDQLTTPTEASRSGSLTSSNQAARLTPRASSTLSRMLPLPPTRGWARHAGTC